MDDNEFSGSIFEWETNKIINYIRVHYVQFLLLICVFIIIYVVDHVSNINAMIFAMPSPVQGLPSQPILTKIKKNKKLKK